MRANYLLVAAAALLAACLLGAVSSEARIDARTVAGMWLFDGDEGDVATDSSSNGNDGILTNDPEWVDGKFGNALEFDGVLAYVDCGNGQSLDIAEAITIVAWVRFDAVDYKNGKGNLFTIAAKGYPDALAPHAGWWFSHDNRNNGQSFNYTCFGHKNGGWAGGGNNLSGVNFAFDKDEWYHLAITVGDSVGRLYVNGTQLGIDKPFANLVLSDTSRNLTIGSAGTSWYFGGLIDEFAVFDVELDGTDLQEIMDEGLERATGLTAVDPSGKLTLIWGGVKQW